MKLKTAETAEKSLVVDIGTVADDFDVVNSDGLSAETAVAEQTAETAEPFETAESFEAA